MEDGDNNNNNISCNTAPKNKSCVLEHSDGSDYDDDCPPLVIVNDSDDDEDSGEEHQESMRQN
jgi:hypothetical protein